MRTVLYILLFISASKATYCKIRQEHTVRCSNITEDSLTFEPSEDRIEGRYRVDWCTQAEKDVTRWELVMRYIESKKPSRCQNYTNHFPLGLSHSRFELPVVINLNCTKVCLSTHLDLVFNDTCYHIRTLLRRNTLVGSSYDSLHSIVNNFTKEHFTNSLPVVSTPSYEAGMVELNWYLGYVPATEYSVEIWDQNMTYYNSSCRVRGLLCSEVSCLAKLSPRCYTASFEHHAPWIAAHSLFGSLANIEHSFLTTPGQSMEGVPEALSSPAGAWRAGAGLAAAVVLVVVILFALRRRRFVHHWPSGDRRVQRRGDSSVGSTVYNDVFDSLT